MGGDGASAPRTQTSADGDVASLSTNATGFRASIESLADRAQNGEDRSDIVDAARARLESGSLDRPEVFDAVARTLLSEG